MSETENIVKQEETTATPCCAIQAAGMRSKEAAAYLGFSTVTLNSIIRNDPHAIPHYYTGGMRIFSKKALDNWLEKPVQNGASIDLAPLLQRK